MTNKKDTIYVTVHVNTLHLRRRYSNTDINMSKPILWSFAVCLLVSVADAYFTFRTEFKLVRFGVSQHLGNTERPTY